MFFGWKEVRVGSTLKDVVPYKLPQHRESALSLLKVISGLSVSGDLLVKLAEDLSRDQTGAATFQQRVKLTQPVLEWSGSQQ